MEMKTCTKCKQAKPTTEFWADSGRPDGLFSWCKECNREKARQWKARNREKVKASAKLFAETHPERQKAWHKAWRDRPENKAKMAAYAAAYRAKHPERHERNRRNAAYLRKYGITLDDYETMVAAQDGRCAICRVEGEEPPSKRQLVVDHCHDTGRVRGLLCQPCNRALHRLMADQVWFNNASAYLQR